VKKTAIYFFGLIFLITAGLVILNAQDDSPPADNIQPAAAQSNAVEAAQAGQEKIAGESLSISAETNVAAIPAQTEIKPEQSKTDPLVETNLATVQPQSEVNRVAVIKPDQSKEETSAESKTGKEAAKSEKTSGFEIDRGGTAGKGMAGRETVQKSATAAEPVVENKPAAKEKRESKGLFGGLFGSRKKEQTQNSAQSSAAVAGDKDKAAYKELTPEELLAAQEEVRRQASEIDGLKKLDQAYQEMSRNEFETALKSFQAALSAMPVRPYTVETRQKAMRSEAECAYRLALKNYMDGKVKEAQEGINRALEFYPAHRAAARLNERIRQDEARRAQLESQPIPPKMSPAYQDKQKTIKAEIRRGREYMAIKEYDNAEAEFTRVLGEDNLNPEATANLKKIAETRYNLETDEFQRMKAEMLAQIRNTWTPPVKKVITGPKGETAETIITSQSRRRLLEKLNNITIEKIDFRNADIAGVITYLNQQGVVSDRDQTPGEKGVNIILNLRRPGQASVTSAPAAPQAEAADVFAAEGAKPAGGTAEAGSSIPPITLTLTHISLMQALKYITELAGLKYRIEDNVVVLFPADVAYGELESRNYKVQPSIVETFMGGGGGAATGGEDDKLEIGAGGTAKTERQDMKQFFINAGIPFPEGTTISYIPGQTLLIVKNTAENLENFERLLNQLNVPPVQVEIEARFVEIGQTDLEELGLEWILNSNWTIAQKQSSLPPSMRERLQMNKGDVTKGLRNLAADGTAATGGTLGNIATFSSILTNPELSVILHALEQQTGANLLSAPKVTTKSGSQAEIKVVQELIYPTEYQQNIQSLGTTSSGNQSVTKVVVTPSAFETRDTGVILTVTPTVGPDNETIDLAMVPQVVELSEWIDYGSDVPTGDGNNTQHVPLNQPIFHSRSITTSISIWDGQTVVMGGLITEAQENTEDKIPLLGDIPLVGYLFRSKTSQSVKKNLLIFVTANLVDPAGNKINKKENTASLSAAAGITPATP